MKRDMLIAMENHRVNEDRWNYPGGVAISTPFMSIDKRENFSLDTSWGEIYLLKETYQNTERDCSKNYGEDGKWGWMLMMRA